MNEPRPEDREWLGTALVELETFIFLFDHHDGGIDEFARNPDVWDLLIRCMTGLTEGLVRVSGAFAENGPAAFGVAQEVAGDDALAVADSTGEDGLFSACRSSN